MIPTLVRHPKILDLVLAKLGSEMADEIFLVAGHLYLLAEIVKEGDQP